MFKKNFLYKSFQKKFFLKKDIKKITKILKKIVVENNEIVKSLSHDYKNSYKKNNYSNIKRNSKILE